MVTLVEPRRGTALRCHHRRTRSSSQLRLKGHRLGGSKGASVGMSAVSRFILFFPITLPNHLCYHASLRSSLTNPSSFLFSRISFSSFPPYPYFVVIFV